MKGRKPKYPQETINDLAARQAAGESAAALSAETGIPRTSVIRCRDSARVPAEATEVNVELARSIGAVTRERLYWRAVDGVLRRIVNIAPKLSDKAVPAVLESLAKIRPLVSSARPARATPEIRKTEETVMILQRHFERDDSKTIEAAAAENPSSGVLGGSKGDASESTSDAEPASDPGPNGEGNGAT